MKASRAWRALGRIIEQHRLPEERQEDRVPESACGHCGMMLNGATKDDGGKPVPGSLGVCWSCAGVNEFDESLQLRALDEKDVAAIDCDQEHLEEARALIRAAMTGSHRRGRGRA